MAVSDPERLTRKIRAALAPCSLGQWPTPLEPVPPALARALGLEALWVKREDRSSPRYGGDKGGRLEFLLAGAPPGSVFVARGGSRSAPFRPPPGGSPPAPRPLARPHDSPSA